MEKKKKFKLAMPSTCALLFMLTIFAAILTWIVPAGEFDTQVVDGRNVVIAGTYHAIEQNPQNPWDVLNATVQGFQNSAVLMVMIMFIVTAVETVGDISGVTEGGMGREATDTELSGGIICDGLGSSFAALFGVLPNTSFSQNVGLVTMTKIVNRMALACGAVFLVLCGLFPKLAALVSIMPQSVLGGAAVIMFSSIVMSGIQLITREPLTARSMSIVSVALGLGYGLGANSAVLSGLPQAVQLVFGGSGIVPAAFVAIIMNVLLPKEKAQA